MTTASYDAVDADQSHPASARVRGSSPTTAVGHRGVRRPDRYPAGVRIALFVGLPLLLWIILILGGRALLG